MAITLVDDCFRSHRSILSSIDCGFPLRVSSAYFASLIPTGRDRSPHGFFARIEPYVSRLFCDCTPDKRQLPARQGISKTLLDLLAEQDGLRPRRPDNHFLDRNLCLRLCGSQRQSSSPFASRLKG